MSKKFSHVWEVIQELDAWMQFGIQRGIEVREDQSFAKKFEDKAKIFERARDLLADAFPNAQQSYQQRQEDLGLTKTKSR